MICVRAGFVPKSSGRNRCDRSVSRATPGRGAFGYDLGGRGSNLADKVQRRSEGRIAFLPLRRTDFARMRGHVLGGLDLAQ